MKQTVYVSSPESQQIHIWRLDDFKSELELMQVVCTPGNAQPIVIHPNQQLLYTGIRPNFGIVTYAINYEGLLNIIKITKISNSPTYLTIHEKGTFLYCVSYNDNALSVFSINKLGIPDNLIQIVKKLLGCHSANIGNDKNLLWIPCLQEHVIRIFDIHKFHGTLTPYQPDRIIINDLSGPRHMTFHGFFNYAYVINELNGTINVIQYDSKNLSIPTIIQTINILPNNNIQRFWSADIHITPNNHWLYCTDRFSSTISCFQVLASSMELKFINYQYTEKQPRSFAIDNTGQFLIIAGQKSNHVSLYYIDSTNGTLSLVSRYISGIGPMWVYIISHETNNN